MKTCVFAFRPSFRPRVRRRETASKKAHTTEHTKRTHGASVQTESGRFVWRVCSRVRLHEGDGQAVARVARRHDPQRRPGQHDHASGSRHVHGRRRRQVHPVHAVHPQGRPGVQHAPAPPAPAAPPAPPPGAVRARRGGQGDNRGVGGTVGARSRQRITPRSRPAPSAGAPGARGAPAGTARRSRGRSGEHGPPRGQRPPVTLAASEGDGQAVARAARHHDPQPRPG
jgi:hypothetical protein